MISQLELLHKNNTVIIKLCKGKLYKKSTPVD